MTRIVNEIARTLSASPAIFLVVKGTVAVMLGLLGAWLARTNRAAVRHALLASAFSVLLALPIVSLIAKPVPITVPVAKDDAAFVPLYENNSAPSSAASAAFRSQADSTEHGRSVPPISVMLLYAWFIGTVIFLIPIIAGLLQIRSLRRFGLPWSHGQTIVSELPPGLRRRVEVLVHESLPGPMTCGVLRPAIILPMDAQNWDAQDLERAVVHELEHIRRYDWATHCLARVACAVYWFHPLVWTASRKLELEAERSCDDAVLGNSEPAAYADQLMSLAKRLRSRRSPALAMANRSDLSARVGALLNERQQRGPVGAWLVAIAAIGAAAILLTMSPLRMVAAPQGDTTLAAQDIPRWDAVAIKRCIDPPGARGEGRGGGGAQAAPSPDRLMLNCVPLSVLVASAYEGFAGGHRNQDKMIRTMLEKFPDWTNSERFTIEAKAQGSPGPEMMRGPMLQALLEDRFRLKVHEETREGKVFILRIAKGGPKMEALEPGGCIPRGFGPSPAGPGNPCPYTAERDGNMGFDGWMNMDSFALIMTSGIRNPQSPLDAPVLNQTGLTGFYHVQWEYSPLNPVAGAPLAASVFTAVQKLGLKFEAGKGPNQFLVFDHAERPTDN
ncbi:MAG TPA: M56 family metallopeptidase [Bryobacteraceae bacterium]|nr:M56 family metallopeptidase [Bryobacteraceae bacterium]